VQQVYADFGRGDLQGLLALLADDIEYVSPGDGLPLAGTYRGHAAVTNHFEKLLSEVQIEALDPREFIAEGDRVLVVGWERGKVSASNRKYEYHWVMAFTVRDGKITNIQEYNDTLALARAFSLAANAAA
jgi:ketosteroid isomerase-like protein